MGLACSVYVGCLVVPVLFVVRRCLPETEAFGARRQRPGTGGSGKRSVRNWGVVLIGVMLVTMTTVSFYLITAYTPTFGKQRVAPRAPTYLTVTLCVGVSNFFWLPIMGAVSDRVGRMPILAAPRW